jgi:hypothetical protein
MNVTVRLTMDGMIRALRWRAHEMAEGADDMYVAHWRETGERQGRPSERDEGGDDDRGRE